MHTVRTGVRKVLTNQRRDECETFIGEVAEKQYRRGRVSLSRSEKCVKASVTLAQRHIQRYKVSQTMTECYGTGPT